MFVIDIEISTSCHKVFHSNRLGGRTGGENDDVGIAKNQL